MKWNEPKADCQQSADPIGYTVSMHIIDGEAVFEAWFNAGTDKLPAPVFLGQVRCQLDYRPGRKAAAHEVRAACEKHAQTVIDNALRTTSNS